jgi:hypothetical protein
MGPGQPDTQFSGRHVQNLAVTETRIMSGSNHLAGYRLASAVGAIERVRATNRPDNIRNPEGKEAV